MDKDLDMSRVYNNIKWNDYQTVTKSVDKERDFTAFDIPMESLNGAESVSWWGITW